jgi:membrane protein
VATAAWQLAKFGFGLYLRNAVGYGKLYGNLGLLPIFLFWIWIAWVIVLGGAQTAYTLQNLDRLTAAERRRHGAPFIQPGLVALGLVLHAGRAFLSGKGPVSADELAESTGLPDLVWHRLVDLLVERRILVEAGPDGTKFIPGRPLESVTVEEVFGAVEDTLMARPDESWHPEQEHLQGLANLLTQARQRELGNKSIAELLANGLAQGPTGERALPPGKP